MQSPEGKLQLSKLSFAKDGSIIFTCDELQNCKENVVSPALNSDFKRRFRNDNVTHRDARNTGGWHDFFINYASVLIPRVAGCCGLGEPIKGNTFA